MHPVGPSENDVKTETSPGILCSALLRVTWALKASSEELARWPGGEGAAMQVEEEDQFHKVDL